MSYCRTMFNREIEKLCYIDADSFIVYIKKVIFRKMFLKMFKIALIVQIMKSPGYNQNKRMKVLLN